MAARKRAIVLAASLIASAGVIGFWVRSYGRAGDALVWCDRRGHPDPGGRAGELRWHEYRLTSCRGHVGVERYEYQDEQFLRGSGYRRAVLYLRFYNPPPPWEGRAVSRYVGWEDDLIVGRQGTVGSETRIRGFVVSHGVALAVTALPAVWLLARRALRRRVAEGPGFLVVPKPPVTSAAAAGGAEGAGKSPLTVRVK
jgi:hypothetical protein